MIRRGRRALLLALGPGLALALGLGLGCGGEGGEGGGWSYTSKVDLKSFRGGGEPRRIDYEVPPGKDLELRIAVELERGELSLRLLDPRGEERWRELFAGPGDHVREEVVGSGAGTWTAIVAPGEEARGRYDLRLVARRDATPG